MCLANFTFVSTDYGAVDLIINSSSKAEYILLLAHGAGAGMTHPFMEQVAEAFSESIFTVVRFNFAYMQNGKKLPDSPTKAHHVIEKVYGFALKNLPDLPIILSGKSYGGRMSSQFTALNNMDIFGLIFFGFPLHTMGKPSIDRADHLKEISKPMLFLQGSRDKLAQLDLMKDVAAKLPLAKLHVIENADHSFNIPKKSIINNLSVFQVFVNEAVTWITQNTSLNYSV